MTGEHWRRNKPVFFGVFSPPAVWLAALFFAPLAAIFLLSFSSKTGIRGHELTWTLENYARAFEPLYLSIFAKSLVIAAAATAFCFIAGYPVAMAIAFAPRRAKMPLLLAVTLPFWINGLVRTYALIAVFRERGFLNFALEFFWDIGRDTLSFLGLDIGGYSPLSLLYSDAAVAAGVAYVFIPFMILPIYASMERFDRSLLEAALDLGAGHWRAFRTVLLPLTMPGVISGVIIVFVPAMGAFFIADMLGGKNIIIGNVIERQFLGANNWPFGAALSFLLMYITFAAVALRAVFVGRRGGV